MNAHDKSSGSDRSGPQSLSHGGAQTSRRSALAMLLATAAYGATAAPRTARAAGYPDKLIRFIVGFPPGGGTDVLARLVGEGLTDVLGVSIIIDNKGGASGTIGTALGAKAKPDGYTLILGSSGAILTAPSLYPSLPYNPRTDFDPVGTLGSYPNILFVPATSSVHTLPELIQQAKARRGELSYGSAGIGSTLHLSAVLLQQLSGMEAVNVPYTSGSMLQADLTEGRLDFAFASSALLQLVKTGRLRAIASTGQKRSPNFPDVPTVAEQGFPDYEVVNWFSLLVPKGAPADVVQALNKALNDVLSRDDMRERLAKDLDFTPHVSTPAEVRDFIVAEQDRWAGIIKSAHIKLN
jgi:tripartite-type tricarboxylate transporter receptor subunit TctC